MLSFLKFGFTDKRHQSLNPTNGKPKKKAVFSLYYGDKITTSLTEPFSADWSRINLKGDPYPKNCEQFW